jgi:hypothetical protein
MDPDSVALAAALRLRMDELAAAIAGADESTAARRSSDGAWSVKECLSHVHGADGDTFLDGVMRILHEDVPEIDVEPGVTHFDASRKALPLSEMLARVEAQYRTIADVVARCSSEELARRARISLLEQTPIGGEPTLRQWVETMTNHHLAGHIEELRERS